MSDRDQRGAVDTRSLKSILKVKSDLATTLFAGFRASECGPEDCVRRLSFNPGTENSPLDRLTPDSKNADIFTSQCWAALKARELFALIYTNLDEFKKLKIPQKKKSDPVRIDRFGLTIIGSSVSGLTFHATLHYLFEVANLPGRFDLFENSDWGKSLHDLIDVRYVDSHQRPLQRLLQARDRRIVPRFEYERLLRFDFSEIDKNRIFSKDSICPFLEVRNTELIEAWNDTSRFEIYDPLEQILPSDTKFMPEALCWGAGNVRHVADQILQGYESITGGHCFSEYPGHDQGMSSTGGPIYIGTSNIEVDEDGNPKSGSLQVRRAQIQTITDLVEPSDSSRQQSDISTDFVLIATGPGVDISRKGIGEKNEDPKRRFLMNSQGSFWNSPKMELDVVEPDGKQTLILGNGDSAAGAIYSALFQDSEACSFRFLTHLVGHPDYRRWFVELQECVNRYTRAGDTITETWTRAFKNQEVLGVLYKFPKKAGDLKISKDDQAEPSALPKRLMELLRTSVSISLAFRPERDNPVLLSDEGKPHPFVQFPANSEPHDLKKRLLGKAWPENRIIGALLSNQIQVYQENSGDHGNIIGTVASNRNKRTNREFLYTVPLFRVIESRLSARGNINTVAHIFKYVLDCRGPTFFSFKGNHAHSLDGEQSEQEEFDG